MVTDKDPIREDNEYELVASDTPISEDGYKYGEPKLLSCHFCDAAMIITDERSPGIWSLNHELWCPNTEK